MSNEKLIPLTRKRIPTILGFDVSSKRYTIGDEARRSGLHGKGQTAVFNFKPAFGSGDKEFSKDKDYWFQYQLREGSDFGDVRNAHIETFTAHEAAKTFLKTLLVDIDMPERIIIGEPGVREAQWGKNFRRHVREVFSDLGFAAPDFFPEPFAVFQYYRHVNKVLSVAEKAETILIIDIGGGTFNSCIIRTTERGLLARGGASSLPLGLQAGTCGGSTIDKELLKLVINKSKKKGLVWKDDPFTRIEKKKSPVLLRVEDAKIQLSEAMSSCHMTRLSDDFSSIEAPVFLPKDELHPDFEIHEVITGEDLKNVIREMWRRHYGHLIADTVNEARNRLHSAMKISLNRIDKVLVAGGSSRLPFMKEEIQTVLPTLVDRNDIVIGTDIDEAVAYGIAWECLEQARRDPKLSAGQIAPCVLNDLYLGFRATRRDEFCIPRIKQNSQPLPDGQLLSAPFETEATTFTYELELPFDVGDKVFYSFTDKPIHSTQDAEVLNLTHDVFSIPKLGKVARKCDLSLEFKPNGMIKPTFSFRGKGSSARKISQRVQCPEFYVPGFQIKEGSAYVGLDFGNSNSYLVRFANIPHESSTAQYPEFTISSKVKQSLRTLELRLDELRESGVFSSERLLGHAIDEAIEIIFHSNKIEGSPLTRGETEAILSNEERDELSEKQLEAKNLEGAYYWMLDNFESCLNQPEMFIREINRRIGLDIHPACGQYRTEPVSLSGMDFIPPHGNSVPAFMEQLAGEIKSRGPDRSVLEFATSMHTKLVSIHPFMDGNGRTARLLFDACLLANGLPVVVVNYADRERYLHCLSESNDGDLSSMVEFFRECFEQQLREFANEDEPIPVSEEFAETTIASTDVSLRSQTELSSDSVDASTQELGVESGLELDDPIASAINEIETAEKESEPATEIRVEPEPQANKPTTSDDYDDPLAAVMKEKVFELERVRRAEYDAWRQAFLAVQAELKAIIESFNQEYSNGGYQIWLKEYDVLTFEKYDDIDAGRRATKTWFLGITIARVRLQESILLFFNRASWSLTQDPMVSLVSLTVSRYDGAEFQRLTTEPITLREIGYRNGELLFCSKEEIMPSSEVRQVLKGFLAEVIKSYL